MKSGKNEIYQVYQNPVAHPLLFPTLYSSFLLFLLSALT